MLDRNQTFARAFACLMLTSAPAALVAQDQPAPFSLGTLVLSGERSERTLTDTYVGVTVLDEARLEKSQTAHIHDVLASTPNLFVEGKSELPTLRGIQGPGPGGSALTGFTGALPRLAFVIDGVTRPNSIPFSSGSSLWDVQQVEVFRGPQSLLRGRSAIAGSIVIETRDPTFEPEAALQLGVEIDQFHDQNVVVNGMVSGPITNNIAGRFTFELAQGEDARDVVSAFPADWVTEYDNIRLRGKLLGEWETDLGRLTVNFAAEYQDGQTPQTRNTVSGPGGFATPTGRVLLSPETNARTYDTETSILSLDAKLETDAGDFQFFTSYLDDNFKSVPEQTFPSPVDVNEELTTFEFIYSFGEDQRVRRGELSGLVGVHFEDRSQDGQSAVPTPAGPLQITTSSSSDTTSIYTDLRYGISDKLTVFGGARMLWFDGNRTQISVAPPPLMSANQSVPLSEEEFLPAIGLAYYFSETNVLSGSLRTGYNPGGVGLIFFAGLPYTFESENVTTAEATFRGENALGTLSYGVTAFYNWHDDPQLFVELIPLNRATLQVINQPEGISYGLEVDGVWQVTDRVRLDAALGVLETEVTQASATQPLLNGNSFGQDPNVTFSLGGQVQLTRVLSADARATYRGESFSDVNNNPGDKVGDYWLFDLGVTAEWNDSVTLRGYVTNVFDEIGVTRFVGGGAFADVTAPRTFGVTLTSRF